MNILSANQDTTTRFAVTIEEINAKYKKEKKDLKRIIAETARSQAEQILANEDDDSMGDPKEMLNELMPLRLQYNSIVIKQKQEMDIAMDRYNVEIWNNMGNEKITCIKKNYDDAIRLEEKKRIIPAPPALKRALQKGDRIKAGSLGKGTITRIVDAGSIYVQFDGMPSSTLLPKRQAILLTGPKTSHRP